MKTSRLEVRHGKSSISVVRDGLHNDTHQWTGGQMELLKRIEELLRQRDVTSVTIDDDGLIFQAKCEPTSIRIRISVSDAALVVRGFIPFFVPANRRQAIAEAISLANWQLRYVRFEMDSDDGELRCRGDLPLFDAVPTDKQLTNLVYAVWSNTERYAPALLQVMVAGADPALAIGIAEANEEERPQQTRNTDLTVN
jgi:hypothetical protein